MLRLSDFFVWRYQHADIVSQNRFVLSEVTRLKRLKVLTIIDVDGQEDVRDSSAWMCYDIAKKLLLHLQRTDKEDKVFVLKYRTGETTTVALQYRKPSLV